MSNGEDSLKADREMLLKLVEWYVSPENRQVSANGEYAQVSNQDFLELHSIIEGIIALRCEANSSGEYPMEFQLVNLLEEEPLKFSPVPLTGKSRKMVMLANLAKASEKIADLRKMELETMIKPAANLTESKSSDE